MLSKINTVLQVLTVVLVLLSNTLPQARWSDLLAQVAIYGVAVLTLASGLDYVIRVGRLQPSKTPQS